MWSFVLENGRAFRELSWFSKRGTRPTAQRRARSGAMSASSSGSEIAEEVLHDENDGSDVEYSPGVDVPFPGDAVYDAVTHSPGGSGGEESPDTKVSDAERYSDDFGSEDVSDDCGGEFLDEPVDEAPDSPGTAVPSGVGGVTGATVSPVKKAQPFPETTEIPGEDTPAGVPARRTATGDEFFTAEASNIVWDTHDDTKSEDTSDTDEFPKLFKWETSPSASREFVSRQDALASSCFNKNRPDPTWANPTRIASLVQRALQIASRRATVVAMTPTQRRARRYAMDTAPVRVGALTIAKAQAANLSAATRAEAIAIAKDIETHAVAHRKRMTPTLAKAMYIRRGIVRAAAADGARVVAELEGAKSNDDGEKTRSTPRVLHEFLLKKENDALGSVGGHAETERGWKKRGLHPSGEGKKALVRRLWASHQSRRDAASSLSFGDANAAAPPPKTWTELSLGAAKDDGLEGKWWDNSAGTLLASSHAGTETVAVLRESAELRRRAREVL
jgi:hypothetical protein